MKMNRWPSSNYGFNQGFGLPFIIDRFRRVAVDRPQNLDLMIKLAGKLSAGFSFVRVDFYGIEGKVY